MPEKDYEKEIRPVSTGNWYFTFMAMGIPIIGWIYLAALSVSKKHPLKREFARAYLLYKLSLLITCIILIGIMIWVIMPYAEKLLDYMEML